MQTTTSLEDLKQQLIEHPGQLVLVVTIGESSHPGVGGCFGPDYVYTRQVVRYLGIIAEVVEDWPPDNPFRLDLPTVSYYEDEAPSCGQVRAGTLSDGHIWLPLLDVPVEYKDPDHQRYFAGDVQLQVVVGDEAVQAWFRQAPGLWPRREYDPLWLQQAAEALERPLAEAPELEAYKARRRPQVIEAIWAAGHEVHRLVQELATIKGHRGARMVEGALQLVEDDDDARVISIGPNRDLKAAQQKLQRLVEQALELGLAGDPAVVAHQQRYLPALGK